MHIPKFLVVYSMGLPEVANLSECSDGATGYATGV